MVVLDTTVSTEQFCILNLSQMSLERKHILHSQIKSLNTILLTVHLSQAAACDGTTVTTSAVGQEYVPGTLPIY